MIGASTSEPPVDGDTARANALVQFYRYVLGIGHERNVGGTERTVRYTAGGLFLLVGVGVLAFPVAPNSLVNAIVAFAALGTGLFLIYEAQVQYCPLNHSIGRSTYTGD